MRTITPPPAQEALTLPATVDVVTAGRYFGLGKDGAYAAVRDGTYPCQVLRIGGRRRVTRAALLAALGITDPGNSLASGSLVQVIGPATDA